MPGTVSVIAVSPRGGTDNTGTLQIAVDGTPTNVTFYKVRFGSKGLTDCVSPNHGAITVKTDAAKAAISAGNRPWVKGI